MGAAELSRCIHVGLSERGATHARPRSVARRTRFDRAHGLLQAGRETAVGVGARLARNAPHGFSRAGGRTWRSQMNTHTALHAVPDVDAHRARALPEHAGSLVAGAGAPVVLLHSSLSSKSQWTALAERLASRFRVIPLDLCRYGDNALTATGD